MRRPEREESLINFQILALMCLIALSFATSLACALPRWTPQRRPCGNRADFHLCIFSLGIIRCTIAAAARARLKAAFAGTLRGELAGCRFTFFLPQLGTEGQRGCPGKPGRPGLPSLYGWLAVSLNVAARESLGDLGDVEFHQRGPEGKHEDQNGVGSNHWEHSDWLSVIVHLIFPPSSLILESGQISIFGLIWQRF